MAKIAIKGTIVSDSDKWVYDWLGISATCPLDVHNIINDANGEDLEVEINSGGGDVIAGNEIYTALRRYKGNVNIIISGMAASAASYIAMARHCEMTPVGIFMIHNASGSAKGDYRAMDKESEILQTVNKAIAAAYMEKTQMSQEDLLNLMDSESWMTAEETLERGFIDGILENQEYAAQTTNREVGFFNGKKSVALYNAATILDRDTIDKAKEMLLKGENITPADAVPTSAESVLNNKIKKEVDEMEGTQENISTVEELTAKYPALVQQIKDSAALSATNAENERLKAIDSIAGQISEAMVNEAKYGMERMTAETLALEAFKRNGIMAKEALNNLKADIADSGAENVGTTGNAGYAGDSGKDDREAEVNDFAAAVAERRAKR